MQFSHTIFINIFEAVINYFTQSLLCYLTILNYGSKQVLQVIDQYESSCVQSDYLNWRCFSHTGSSNTVLPLYEI